jgi:hypothetical protein
VIHGQAPYYNVDGFAALWRARKTWTAIESRPRRERIIGLDFVICKGSASPLMAMLANTASGGGASWGFGLSGALQARFGRWRRSLTPPDVPACGRHRQIWWCFSTAVFDGVHVYTIISGGGALRHAVSLFMVV